jgi:hypothetical protein
MMMLFVPALNFGNRIESLTHSLCLIGMDEYPDPGIKLSSRRLPKSSIVQSGMVVGTM